MKKTFRQQVSLLLSVLPEVAKERCFALHGGTANQLKSIPIVFIGRNILLLSGKAINP
jgi:hypothetical protein